ncbi:conserved hypothetical protein [Ixodes scapularis]|uniref:Uncharacterized protein n=1 Tax=Ixodes scapularis TaxID=6945 RepID=B7Q0U5_IXOSC|nr:conserved hypothetical protein [Ixodes scapularis]|eukprot:XP_002408336.1 conserved hypothetical protein [Ixodes scapularis]
MGNLAIVLLLLRILSSSSSGEAVQGYPFRELIFSCVTHVQCMSPKICDAGSCKAFRCKDNSECRKNLNCVSGFCLYRDGGLHEDDIFRNIGRPCKISPDCYYDMVCQNGSCQRNPRS